MRGSTVLQQWIRNSDQLVIATVLLSDKFFASGGIDSLCAKQKKAQALIPENSRNKVS